MAVYPSNLTSLKNQAAARAGNRARRRLAGKLREPLPGTENRQPQLSRRWATVAAVNPDSTVQLTLDGQLVADTNDATPLSVFTLDSYSPAAGDNVIVDFLGHEPLVVGNVGTDMAVGGLVFHWIGPAATTSYAAATTVTTQAVTLAAGHVYEASLALNIGQQITAAGTGNTQVWATDSAALIIPNGGVLRAAISDSPTVGSHVFGQSSTILTPAAAVTDTFTIHAASPGTGFLSVGPNDIELIVKRVS